MTFRRREKITARESGIRICQSLADRTNSSELGSLVFISLILISHLIKGGKQEMRELPSLKRHVYQVVSRDFSVSHCDFLCHSGASF